MSPENHGAKASDWVSVIEDGSPQQATDTGQLCDDQNAVSAHEKDAENRRENANPQSDSRLVWERVTQPLPRESLAVVAT